MRLELDMSGLRRSIRDIPDFPTPGVIFKDITPLLADPTAFSSAVDAIVVSFGRGSIDKVVGIEARGFIIAAPVAYHFGAGFVPLRKRGKLPYDTLSETYNLEYGSETLEVHADAFRPRDRVLVVDDVLATGGTAKAARKLIEKCGPMAAGAPVGNSIGLLGGATTPRGIGRASRGERV